MTTTSKHPAPTGHILLSLVSVFPSKRVRVCAPEAVNSLQFLLQHFLGGGDELQRPHELGGGEEQLHRGLRLVHGGHQLEFIVQLNAVVAGQSVPQHSQRPAAHHSVNGGGAGAQLGHGGGRFLHLVLELVLRRHGVEKGLGAKRNLPSDAHLHHIQIVTQLQKHRQVTHLQIFWLTSFVYLFMLFI